MTDRTLAVLAAGLGRPSSTRLLADRLGAAAADALRERGDAVEVVPVDLRDHAHALTDGLLTGFPGRELRATIEAVTGADGLVAVTPIYNGSYNGLFKTFFDVLEPGALEGRPVLLGATGGTARHSLALDFALRPLLAYLRAAVVPTAVFAATADFGDAADPLAGRAARAGRELADLVAGRAPAVRPDPYAEPTPFADLLAGDPPGS
ncbi:NAD(P)H-dependent FAD/FMN reductase [Actinomadura rubteroloni]|uniref:NAD(P)H-dependent FAD/FMN reductase n=1 Tax=Actinomadura rubteroloni TaxID=1926885 RepID=A0A2P4UFH9_9ACTN|nr:CE1759 family FMN reductase [Actinomadura rubteroloni]POM23782.1 NAD(P)H-dependent FAD/FMN reductase [Actinomadura rubteroloni]